MNELLEPCPSEYMGELQLIATPVGQRAILPKDTDLESLLNVLEVEQAGRQVRYNQDIFQGLKAVQRDGMKRNAERHKRRLMLWRTVRELDGNDRLQLLNRNWLPLIQRALMLELSRAAKRLRRE